MEKLKSEDIEQVCEAYSDHWATYSRACLINVLNVLFPRFNGNSTTAIIAVRKKLRLTYNIF